MLKIVLKFASALSLSLCLSMGATWASDEESSEERISEPAAQKSWSDYKREDAAYWENRRIREQAELEESRKPPVFFRRVVLESYPHLQEVDITRIIGLLTKLLNRKEPGGIVHKIPESGHIGHWDDHMEDVISKMFVKQLCTPDKYNQWNHEFICRDCPGEKAMEWLKQGHSLEQAANMASAMKDQSISKPAAQPSSGSAHKREDDDYWKKRKIQEQAELEESRKPPVFFRRVVLESYPHLQEVDITRIIGILTELLNRKVEPRGTVYFIAKSGSTGHWDEDMKGLICDIFVKQLCTPERYNQYNHVTICRDCPGIKAMEWLNKGYSLEQSANIARIWQDLRIRFPKLEDIVTTLWATLSEQNKSLGEGPALLKALSESSWVRNHQLHPVVKQPDFNDPVIGNYFLNKIFINGSSYGDAFRAYKNEMNF